MITYHTAALLIAVAGLLLIMAGLSCIKAER